MKYAGKEYPCLNGKLKKLDYYKILEAYDMWWKFGPDPHELTEDEKYIARDMLNYLWFSMADYGTHKGQGSEEEYFYNQKNSIGEQ